MTAYSVVMVDMGGRPYTELVRAKVDHVTWDLNSWGEAVYSIPVRDPQAPDAALLLQREVQIWRDGVLIFWGIPVAYSADPQKATFTAFGLLYYFARRYFGPVYSNTMPAAVVNGTFEASPVDTGWSRSSPAPTVAPSTALHYSGSQAVQLTGGGGPVDALHMYYLYQQPSMPAASRSQPLTVTLSAWCYPQGITTYAFQNRGIEIEGLGSPLPQAWALLDANVADRQWTRLETTLVIPRAVAPAVTIALFAPTTGSVIYDGVRLTYAQKTGAVAGEDWVDDYLRRVFNYGAGNSGGGSTGPGGSPTSQDQWWGATVLKSSLGMNFNPNPLAAGGVPVDTFWDHENNGLIYDAMAEVYKRDKADFEITWNAAGTTRGLTSYIPRKGSIKPALALELGRNITAFTYDVDGRLTANDVRVVGRNSGNTKEVGQAGGPAPTTLGGVQFEDVISPAQEVDGQGLIDTAVSSERQRHNPVVVPTVTVKAAGLLDATNVGGPLTTGDIVPVTMSYGIVTENSQRRVVKMTLHPATETVDIVFNAVA